MGNGLSQNEIDALLAGVDETELSSTTPQDDGFKVGTTAEKGSKNQMEDLNEFMNEALSSGFNILSKLTESEISLSKIKSTLKDSDNILNSLQGGRIIIISQELTGALNGEINFVLQEPGALRLAEKMLDQEETVLSEIALNTIGENFNQFLNSIFNWIQQAYKQNVEGDIPHVKIVEDPLEVDFNAKQSVEVNFFIRMGEIDIPMLMVLPVTVSKEIINMTLKSNKEDVVVDESGSGGSKNAGKQINARPVQFSRLDSGSSKSPLGNIEILLDVSMQVTVELGRTKMRIREILGLGEGSIIELQKLAGEPVDILVNGKLIAKGEVVVIDEYFGVRITEIISAAEMMNIMSGKDDF